MNACANCGKNPGTFKWIGDGGALALSHGFYKMWCEVCVVEDQLVHAREQAERVPMLEQKLAAAHSHYASLTSADDELGSSLSPGSSVPLLAPRNEETPEGADRSKERSESALPQGEEA